MTALDTNVLVRLILRDDADQVARAEAVVRDGPCLVTATVLLETAWVLRTLARLPRATIVAELRTALNLARLVLPDERAVRQALDDAEAGMDLADAFHRAFAAGAERLATFDRRFVAAAAARPGVPVVEA